MIQRVQSVYLLLITVLMSFFIVRPYAEFTIIGDQLLAFHAHAIILNGVNSARDIYKHTIAVLSLAIITSLFSFICIFFYNRRITQIRLCIANTILLIVLLLIMLIYYVITRDSVEASRYTFKIPAIFPMLCIIFNFLAYRAIKHDELLVSSFNRIR
jgi:hypothetical protein